MTNYQRQRYDFSQPMWLYALTILAFFALFMGAQMLDHKDATDELRDIAADHSEIIDSAKQHALHERMTHDAQLAAIEYAQEQKQ